MVQSTSPGTAPEPRKVVVIGAGIAGLCTAVYARKCGYQVEVIEQHDAPGGLATSWRRGEYTFETCLHWLTGTNPKQTMHAQWREVFNIDALTFVYQDEFERIESEHGDTLSVYANIDRMEAEFLRRAPQDAGEIKHFTSALRRFAKFPLPDPTRPWFRQIPALLRILPDLPLLRHWSKLSAKEYGERFRDELLRTFFVDNDFGDLSVLALIFMFAWMSEHNAAYVIGGSQAIIRPIRARFEQLGGRLRFGAKVAKILVERDAAVGVELEGGERIAADWVISAADGHATIYDMLGGRYADATVAKTYRTLRPFSSYLQISLGIARTFPQQPGLLTRILDAPFLLDPRTTLGQLSFRFFHYDPTFAPPGKTAVTSFLPTRNVAYWTDLERNDPDRYQTEKQRVAQAVIAILERVAPGARRAVEVIDVSTPATVIRYTGNWQGSYEGWLMTPTTGFQMLRNTLPLLRQFVMAGQWILPGGGLPSGLFTARAAVRTLCRHDRVPFCVP